MGQLVDKMPPELRSKLDAALAGAGPGQLARLPDDVLAWIHKQVNLQWAHDYPAEKIGNLEPRRL